VQDTCVGDVAGVPHEIVEVAPAVGVLFDANVSTPILVEALNIVSCVGVTPYWN
jgi:hypothetical protein